MLWWMDEVSSILPNTNSQPTDRVNVISGNQMSCLNQWESDISVRGENKKQ